MDEVADTVIPRVKALQATMETNYLLKKMGSVRVALAANQSSHATSASGIKRTHEEIKDQKNQEQLDSLDDDDDTTMLPTS